MIFSASSSSLSGGAATALSPSPTLFPAQSAWGDPKRTQQLFQAKKPTDVPTPTPTFVKPLALSPKRQIPLQRPPAFSPSHASFEPAFTSLASRSSPDVSARQTTPLSLVSQDSSPSPHQQKPSPLDLSAPSPFGAGSSTSLSSPLYSHSPSPSFDSWRNRTPTQSPSPSLPSFSPSISPSFASASQRRDRIHKKFDDYRTTFPWIKRGKLVSYPLPFRNMEITERFLKTKFGEKALIAAKAYIEERSLAMLTPEKCLLGMKFVNGTCLGQSYSLMTAFIRLEGGEPGSLLSLIESDHILFFHTLEHLRAKEQRDSGKRVEAISLSVLKELSGLERRGSKKYDLGETSKEDLEEIFTNTYNVAFEIGMYGDGFAHSIIALCGKKNYLYDLQTGLIEYPSREAIAADLFELLELKRQVSYHTVAIEPFAIPRPFTPLRSDESKKS